MADKHYAKPESLEPASIADANSNSATLAAKCWESMKPMCSTAQHALSGGVTSGSLDIPDLPGYIKQDTLKVGND